MWSTEVGGSVHSKNRLVSLRQHRATEVRKLRFLSSCQYTHGCCAPASWAARHTTVCLDSSQSWCMSFLGDSYLNSTTILFDNMYMHTTEFKSSKDLHLPRCIPTDPHSNPGVDLIRLRHMSRDNNYNSAVSRDLPKSDVRHLK